MLETKNKTHRWISVAQILDDYRQHPSMRRVEIFKAQLKQEKQEDKLFYQSIKEQIATR